MAIATYSTYTTRKSSPYQLLHEIKQGLNVTNTLGKSVSLWTSQGKTVGVAPSTAAVPSSTIAGAIAQADSSGVQRLVELGCSSVNGGMLILCDRLSHQGGLSGTVTTAQTTNLPTAALTRYTSGVGVFCGFEVYTAVGGTGTTITASYTNDAGTSGQTSQATVFGGNNDSVAGYCKWMPLAQGDLGVRAVANVTVLASTGTAGNFGVTLFKPLIAYPIIPNADQDYLDGLTDMLANVPQILTGACLYYQFVPNGGVGGSSVGVLQLSHMIVEE